MIPALAALCVFAHASPPVPPPVQDDAARVELMNDRDLRVALRRLEGAHTDRAALISIGETRGGRSIDVLRLASGELRPGRPALLLVAGMETTQAWTSGLALDHARALLEGYGEDDAITRLLDTTTVYVMARANPDGCERRFEAPTAVRLASGRDADNDRDGRSAEDPRVDLDGDGLVLTMRVPDPEGEWIVDPADPRVLKRADRARGERGAYRLYDEGRDADGDERVAEDDDRDTEWNRNFPAQWEEHQPRAGRFSGEEPGVKAAMDFVLTHPEIALVVAYGERDDLVAAPKTMGKGKRGEELPGRPADDVALLKELGRRYAEAVTSPREGATDEEGRFQTWLVQHRGLPCVSIHPWSAPAEMPEAKEAEGEAPDDASAEESVEEAASAEETASTDEASRRTDDAPQPSDDAKELAWLEAEGVDAFRDWTPFEHPELGAVEIGGWVPYARVEPPARLRDALADEHLAFLLELGAALPRVEVASCTARPLGGDLYEVEAVVENPSLMPLTTELARDANSVRPVRVRLALAEGDRLVSGPPVEFVDRLDAVGGRREVRWLVRTSDPTRLTVRAAGDHVGVSTRSAEVQR